MGAKHLLLSVCRHAAELRRAGADKTCIINSEAGLNLGAQLLADLGTSETAISLLRRGINEAMVARTSADWPRHQQTSSSSSGQQQQASNQAASANASEDDSKQKRKKRHEMFVLDGRHAYGLRADVLRSLAASPVIDVPCQECPLVRQGLEGLDSAALSTVSSVNSSSSISGTADAAVVVAGTSGVTDTAGNSNGSNAGAAAAPAAAANAGTGRTA